MKNVFLLTSGGNYVMDDFYIHGLFESEFEMNFDFLIEKRAEYAESLGIDNYEQHDWKLFDDEDLMEQHMIAVLGRDYNRCLDGDYTKSDWPQYLQEYKDKVGDLEINFIQWLVDTNVINRIDYEEINL